MSESFFITGGTLPSKAKSYVVRSSDGELLDSLVRGEYCYVLTSRQMGKSSTMARAAQLLRESEHDVVPLDLTAMGQNLTVEQWYDGLMARIGRLLDLEDEFDDYWLEHSRLSPVQRLFSAIGDVALQRIDRPIVLFVDEVDCVLSLPFASDEFFAAIRECFNRRVVDPAYSRVTFCLLGVAMPTDLIRNPQTTPFNVGRFVELKDFSRDAISALSGGFPENLRKTSQEALDRIFHWTSGHPYLTQKLCHALAKRAERVESFGPTLNEWIDEVCYNEFLSPEAQYRDDNLVFVRQRILRASIDLVGVFELYARIFAGEYVEDDEQDEQKNLLRLSGIVGREDGKQLRVRNHIYRYVFNENWIDTTKPVAELVLDKSRRVRIKEALTIGRTEVNDLTLPSPKVSRRHAMIQVYEGGELWISDLGSKNGVYVNRERIVAPRLLRHRDVISIGPYVLRFQQRRADIRDESGDSTLDKTVFEFPHADLNPEYRTPPPSDFEEPGADANQ